MEVGWRECRFCRSKNLRVYPTPATPRYTSTVYLTFIAVFKRRVTNPDRHGWRKCRFCRSKNLRVYPTPAAPRYTSTVYLTFIAAFNRRVTNPDRHGKDCSYNLIALPPSMEVGWRKCRFCRSKNLRVYLAPAAPRYASTFCLTCT